MNDYSIPTPQGGDGGGSGTGITLYRRGEFPDLDTAVRMLQERYKRVSDYCLQDIVQYNVSYRNFLRTHGTDALISRMLTEAPSLAESPKEVDSLRKWINTELLPLGNYDIRCVNIHNDFELLGRTIHGLQALHAAVERYFDVSAYRPRIRRPEVEIHKIDGLHVGEVQQDYPKFDASDWLDDRMYRHFIIRRHPIGWMKMFRFCRFVSDEEMRICESIPSSLLPMVYYRGSGDYMLVASK